MEKFLARENISAFYVLGGKAYFRLIKSRIYPRSKFRPEIVIFHEPGEFTRGLFAVRIADGSANRKVVVERNAPQLPH